MKIRLSDYIANFLVKNKIKVGFSVVGGGAMYLNDSFGHKKGLTMYYNHNEQASSICAESYARLNNEPALLCVTTGPGGINALNGVCSAYLDSIPMIVISGQVRYDLCSRYEKKLNGANLRSMGDQEYDIVESVKRMTKYAVCIEDYKTIRYELEKAYEIAMTGRKGPVWIDIPVNFQGEFIEEKELKSFYKTTQEKNYIKSLPQKIKIEDIQQVINMIQKSKRPTIYAGHGIRLSYGFDIFKKLVKKLNIPVVTYWNSIDLMEDQDILYCGRAGNMGDRPGNFAIQNSDLVIAIGTRLSIRQVGFDYKTWAREAKVIMVDIDKEEFKKHTIHVDKVIWADAKNFMEELYKNIKVKKLFLNDNWIKICNDWKNKYKVVDENKRNDKNKVNVYAFIESLSKNLKENSLVVVSNGACCVAGHQAFKIKKGTRFYNNNAIASMGYGLPASIGACISNNKKECICLEGDGSIMMNIQELQTIITNNLNIKIFLINNNGYHSIRITQNNLFSNHTKVGIGPESKDLSFPNFKKVAKAFGFKYFSIDKNKVLDLKIKEILNIKGAVFVEIFTNTTQIFEPKTGTKQLSNGKLVSSPLEDLFPFLDKEELKKNMYIKMLEEK